jgi:hypothetical protein
VFFNPPDLPVRPAIVELFWFAPPRRPLPCSDFPFCFQTDSGVTNHVFDIDWSDGTVDTINFRWTVTPEPYSIVLLVTVLGLIGLTLRTQRDTSVFFQRGRLNDCAFCVNRSGENAQLAIVRQAASPGAASSNPPEHGKCLSRQSCVSCSLRAAPDRGSVELRHRCPWRIDCY